MTDDFSQWVCDQIPQGKENAISLESLSSIPRFGSDELFVRACINELLFDGVLIIPDGDKYYRPTKKDYSEVWDFFLSINNPVLFQAMKKAVTEYMTALEKEDSFGH